MEELKAKIKKAINESGFPLEIKIGSALKQSGWRYSHTSYFNDFETLKDREIDISAEKDINGVNVSIFISCKRSSNKQLILYTPTESKPRGHIINPIKCTPIVKGLSSIKKPIHPFFNFRIIDPNISWAKNLLVVKGDKIVQHDHVELLSSLNGIIKASIISMGDGLADTGWRMLHFHFLVWDGLLFNMIPSNESEYDILPTDGGVYEYYYPIRISPEIDHVFGIGDLIRIFGSRHYIDISTPNTLLDKIKNIEDTIISLDNDFIESWGLKYGTI